MRPLSMSRNMPIRMSRGVAIVASFVRSLLISVMLCGALAKEMLSFVVICHPVHPHGRGEHVVAIAVERAKQSVR